MIIAPCGGRCYWPHTWYAEGEVHVCRGPRNQVRNRLRNRCATALRRVLPWL